MDMMPDKPVTLEVIGMEAAQGIKTFLESQRTPWLEGSCGIGVHQVCCIVVFKVVAYKVVAYMQRGT